MIYTTDAQGADTMVLTVELGRDDLDRFVRETEETIGRGLELPGFRKGKAPPEAIRKTVGEARILEAAFQSAMQRSLSRAIAEGKFDVREASDLSVKENGRDRLRYAVRLKLFPAVVVPPLDTVKVERREARLEPGELDNTLEALKASRAVLTDADRPARAGDKLEVDFEIRSGGTGIEGGTSRNHPVMIGGKNFMPGFEDRLIGLKKGEFREFSLTAPADFANKSVAGKKLDFSVTVKEVKNVTLPELNDEFARSLGKFDNIDQLILTVKDGLLAEKHEKEQERLRLAIVDTIADRANCPVPESMVIEQLDIMVRNFDQDLHRHDMELSLYLSKLGKTEDDFRKEWRPEAERQVRIALVLHAVARDRDIDVKAEEVDEALAAMVQSAVNPEGGLPDLDLERMRTVIRARLLNEKTLEFLERTCAA